MENVFKATVIAAALTGCATTAPSDRVATTPYTLNAEEMAAIDFGLRKSMKDPSSAIVGFMKAAKKDGTGVVYVCGHVNGKNSFGAYTGNQPYFGLMATVNAGERTLATFNVQRIGGTAKDADIVVFLCKNYGVF